MSLTATAGASRAMPTEKRKGSPGFFAVLLGRGTAQDQSDTRTTATEKRPLEESRASYSNQQNASAQGKAYAQSRASYAAESTAPPRSSMARDRGRKDTRQEIPPSRPHSTAAFETAIRSNTLSSVDLTKADVRPPVSSMRSLRKETFVDAKETQDGPGNDADKARHARKVSFNTPTSSLRKGRIGQSRLGEAGSSQDSFFSPRAPRPIPKATKPKYTRSASKAEVEERNWNSSTATLQNREESRSQSSKQRRSKGSAYPLAMDAGGESFQAVRVSGPDRVIIVPVTPSSAEDELGPEPRYLSQAPAPAPASRRPGPAPLAPYASMPRRTSQDVSRSKSKPAEVQRSRSHRERRSFLKTDADASAAKESSRSRSRPDKAMSRPPLSTRPTPQPMVGATVLSQNMAKARSGDRTHRASYHGSDALRHDIATMPPFHERHSHSRLKAQRA